MSAVRGSLTYARFFVEGDLPDDFRETFVNAIRKHAMRPLIAEEDDLERSGWSKLGAPFEIELHYEDVFYNEFLVLGFRTDRWQIPASLLQARLREAEEAYLAKKGRERLGRKEKADLKEIVARKLRKETAPTTRVVDVAWSLGDGLIRFFSHSAKSGAAMSELFDQTFGLKLIPESPYALAARLGLSKAQEQLWQDRDFDVTNLASAEALASSSRSRSQSQSQSQSQRRA